MCAVLFTNPLEESQWYSCLICLLSCFTCQSESLVVVTGSRVTRLRICFFSLLTVSLHISSPHKMQQTADWHGMLEGTGE